MSSLISVILPTYNCKPYIGAAIKSILNQTYGDFELIIIDDASTDGTRDVIKTFTDERILFIEKPKNTGYTESLNHGLRIAKGTYIARMDADDISLPERFEKQVAFLEQHPEVVVCGTGYNILGTHHTKIFPEQHEDLKIELLRGSCFGHPTVMIRKQVLDDHALQYDVTKEPAEDYELWVRLLPYGKLYNLQEVLLQYRTHEHQVSQTQRTVQLQSKLATRLKVLDYCGVNLSPDMRDVLKQVLSEAPLDFEAIHLFIKTKAALISANKSTQFFDTKGLGDYLQQLEKQALTRYFLKQTRFTPKLFFQYTSLKRQTLFRFPFKTECILFAKSMLFYANKKEVVN